MMSTGQERPPQPRPFQGPDTPQRRRAPDVCRRRLRRPPHGAGPYGYYYTGLMRIVLSPVWLR